MFISRSKMILIGVTAIVVSVVVVGLIVEKDGRRNEQAGDLEKRLEQLRSVPYTFVTEEKVDTRRSGVVIHSRGKAYQGYNIYCARTRPEVCLMDMTGKIVHRWSYSDDNEFLWNHAIMLENGDVVVINKFRELLRLDWDSNLIWKREIDVHHEVVLAPDSTFYVIERGINTHRQLLVRFPSILHLTYDAEEIDRWSAHEHLDEIKATFDQTSFLDTILDSLLADRSWPEVCREIGQRAEPIKMRIGVEDGALVYDMFHLNTISILPETPLGRVDKRFKAGNLLICFRNVNQIAVLEKDTKEILWVWGAGSLEWPHHPTMVSNGNVLIFDNGVERKYSRVIELDPVTETIEWEYVADPQESFYTLQKGSAQRLPNGNTLVCDGDNGRAFEVTRESEIVWEWLNPECQQGHRLQVYRMMRLPPALVEPLLIEM